MNDFSNAKTSKLTNKLQQLLLQLTYTGLHTGFIIEDFSDKIFSEIGVRMTVKLGICTIYLFMIVYTKYK